MKPKTNVTKKNIHDTSDNATNQGVLLSRECRNI